MSSDRTSRRFESCVQDVLALPSAVRRALAEMAALDAQVSTAYAEASRIVSQSSSARRRRPAMDEEQVAQRVALLSQTAEECGERRIYVAKALQATLIALDRDIAVVISDFVPPPSASHTECRNVEDCREKNKNILEQKNL